MRTFLWNGYIPEAGTPLANALLSQELSVTFQTTGGKSLHAVISADYGIAILLVAFASLVVAALGFWSVLAIVNVLGRK